MRDRLSSLLVLLAVSACGNEGVLPNPAPLPAGGGGNAGDAGASIGGLDLRGLDPKLLGVPAPPGIDDARARAAALVAEMTPDEKLALVHGIGGPYAGNVIGVPRLGILPITLHDGPAGVADGTVGATAFPPPLAVAATWDRDLARRFGAAMAAEERAKGVVVQLAPMMNLARSPSAGRNFESFGEDPWLSAALAAADVEGIQSQKVVATAKHFVANEQETDRMSSTSNVDERTLHEVYYAPFEGASRAGVGAVMCSYNLVNGVYACENPTTLGDLSSTLGFAGWVMSDWGATHSTAAAVNAGLDMEMPGASFLGSALASAIDDGSVAEARLNEMATHIVTSLVRVGVVDDWPTGLHDIDARTAEHRALAGSIEASAITLLQNDHAALPLGADVATLAVIGVAAQQPLVVGGGSAQVIATNVVTPLDAITARAGSNVHVTFAASGDDAKIAAESADAALVFVSLFSSEGADHTVDLPADVDALVHAVAAANPRTIVVLETPGSVRMPWASEVSSIVEAWYGGVGLGTSLAAMLFGDANPSGKLPLVFVRDAADLPSPSGLEADYSEGLFIGERWLDHHGIAPLFPFGHGLSYTTFAYSGLVLESGDEPASIRVGFDLTNTGDRAGTEIAQLYVGFPESAEEPESMLRGFARVDLAAGETRHVSLVLGAHELTAWDATIHSRFVPSGTYRLSIGSSARDMKLTTTIDVLGIGP